MKTLFISLFIFISPNLFGQTTNTVQSDTLKKTYSQSNIVRGVDITKSTPNEQGLINYMETLSDEEALELLKSFVVGEIVYKEN
jgi:hypothetical protein